MSGVTYPAFAAGQKLTAALLNAAIPTVAYKASDQTVTNSTTLVNDNDLFFTVVSGATYVIDSYLQWIGNNTGLIKFAFTFPTPSTLHWAAVGPNDTDTGFAAGGTRGNTEWWAKNANTVSPTGAVQYGASTSTLVGRISGLLVCNTSGTLQLQWAQQVSNATSTLLKAGSWMSLKRIA